MKKTICSVALFGAVLLPALAAVAAEWTVPGTHPDLAAALAAARAGDTITLAPGRHTAVDLRIPVGVDIRGAGSEPTDTLLDAGRLGRVLLIDGLADSTRVSNLTLTGGLAGGTSSYEGSGGAVLVRSSPTRFTRVVFRDNEAAAHGGALRAVSCSPQLNGCRFEDNRAPAGGGGAVEASIGSSPVVTACDFTGNVADWGGAVSARLGGSVALIGCRLVTNTATGALGYGGGVFADNGAVVGLIDTIVSGNAARYGGGVACFAASQVNVDHATLVDNRASVRGGGVLAVDASPWIGAAIIAFNEGEAIALVGDSAPYISCTDLAGNAGGDWTPELLAVAVADLNYDIVPDFCSRDPWDPDGLRLDASSPLVGEAKACGMPGIVAAPCGATESPEVPPASGLLAARASPNPFNPRTRIQFALAADERVRIVIHDARGRQVRRLVDDRLAAGDHAIAWDGRTDDGAAAASGVYFVRLAGERGARSLKVTLLK